MTDALLSRCNAGWPEDQIIPRDGKWGSHLRWSLDQYVEIFRLLRAGLLYGALITTRMFVERWTINIAESYNISQATDEDRETFIARVWSRLNQLTQRDIGADWAWLSECIHGREPLITVAESLAPHRAFGIGSGDTREFSTRLIEIARAVMNQLLVAVEHQAREKPRKYMTHIVGRTPKKLIPSNEGMSEELEILADAIHPLDPSIVFGVGCDEILKFGHAYRETISRARAGTVVVNAVIPFHFIGALLERRARSIALARKSLISEAAINDPEEGRAHLYARLYRYGAISEAALLVAEDYSDKESAALRTAALALQSSWQLWLDDTDITLGCLRGVVEQTARATVHRRNKTKAEKLEASRNSANRWIEAAGLRRMNSFGRALGEFSHLTLGSNRGDARRLLIDIQPDNEPFPQQTARLHALDFAANLLGEEVRERLNVLYPGTAVNFRKYVILLDEENHEKYRTEFLERSLKQRGREWKGKDFSQS